MKTPAHQDALVVLLRRADEAAPPPRVHLDPRVLAARRRPRTIQALAAAALVWRAERLLASERGEAERLFKAIAARHPETRWSEIAKKNLETIDRKENGL